ncbi:MAG: ABC transporter permease subunit [Alphaproteobacteria bacterium]|nr:ABC transporter permease subunit [Alphaproteobacteria bacterium]
MTGRPSTVGAAWAVLRNDLRVLFLAPAGWVFLTVCLFLAGLMFVGAVAETGEASLRPAIPQLAVTLLFTLPLITMRQLAEEARTGTLELLLTAPVRVEALVLGKWAASMVLCLGLLAATAPFPAVLFLYGAPDPGVLATGYLGLFACCAAFCAAGLFASSLARDPTVAGALSVLLLLPSWLATAAVDWMPASFAPALRRVSFVEHLHGAATGVLDSGELAWFASVTVGFLLLARASLALRRWR